jgi:hypothetical protein
MRIWISGSTFGFIGAVLASLAYFTFGSTFDQAFMLWAGTLVVGLVADFFSDRPLILKTGTGIAGLLASVRGHHGDNQIGGTHVEA